jgi:hypothetical protein
MSLKNLFIVSDENSNDNQGKKETAKQTKVETPSAEPTTNSFSVFGFGSTPAPAAKPIETSNFSNEMFAKALEIYENGFDSLNQPGYDFYEFYKAVMQVGVDNPQTYPMAYAMATAMDKSITKEKLLSQSDFYINEIEKVYNEYVAKGNAKRQEVINQKNHENQSLLGELELMKQQLEALQTQIADRQTKLSAIDTKYGPIISDVEGRLAANDMAKQKIVSSIQSVKNGITNNLK